MLEVRGVDAYYGAVRALEGVSLEVGEGEIVCIIGANGAGKTTLLNVISGLHDPRAGQVLLDGRPLQQGRPDQVVSRGVMQVPEGRQVFAPLSVRENLEMGAYLRWKRQRTQVEADLEMVFDTFPVLRKRQRQQAGTLSGGEQQMLAIGRGLMSAPRLLLLDEPSMGLAPVLTNEILRIVRSLPEKGCSVLLVEQNALGALSVAGRGYVMTTGRITLSGTDSELLADQRVREAFLGRKRQGQRGQGEMPA